MAVPRSTDQEEHLLITTESTPAPRPTTRLERGLKLFEEHGHLIEEEVAPDFYLCPAQDGERFWHVDYREESCDCPDHAYRGVACVHVYAVGVKLAKRRAKTGRFATAAASGSPAASSSRSRTNFTRRSSRATNSAARAPTPMASSNPVTVTVAGFIP